MNDYQTLDQLVRQINDAARDETTLISGGTDVRSAEQIAAAYARECIEESDEALVPYWACHQYLEVLTEAGAVFDVFDAASIVSEEV